MFDMQEMARQELDYEKKLEAQYRNKLKTLPEGKLTMSFQNGKYYYKKFHNGVQSYIGKENLLVRQLKQRYFLEESLKLIGQNEKVLKAVLKNFRSVSPEAVCEALPSAYRGLLQNSFVADLQGWGDAEYEKNDSYCEHLVHKTMKGELVRSKSEVIIANALFLRGIEYHYEEVSEIGGVRMAPDFRIWVKSKGRFKYWEHFGLVGEPDYLAKAMRKIQHYIEWGYVPWQDVIFTFEDIFGNIDTEIIDKLIADFCV